MFTKYTHAPSPYLPADKLGGYATLVENSTKGGVQENMQTVFGPDGAQRMQYQLHTERTGTEENAAASFRFQLMTDGSGYDSTGTYTHSTSGTVVSGSFSGEFTTVSAEDGKTSTMPFTGTILADKTERPIEFPEVVEGSAVTVTTRRELSDAMTGVEYYTPFDGIELHPSDEQLTYAFLFLLLVGDED